MEEDKEVGLKDMLGEILKNQQAIQKEQAVKKWKVPWKARVGKRQASKGYATVQVIRDNGDIEFTKRLVQDGVVEVEGFPRVATINHKLSYKGKPFYIIPTWSLKPFSPAENYLETEKEKMNIAGRRAVLSALESEKIKTKKDMGNMVWIIVAIVAIGGIWYFGKQQGWF